MNIFSSFNTLSSLIFFRSKLLFLSFVTLIAISNPIWAATYTVTNTNDSGAGSLRQAILDANTDGASDTINFAIPASDPGCSAVVGKSAPVCTIRVGSDIHTFGLRLRNFCTVNVTPSSTVGSVVGTCTVVAKTPYLGAPPINYIEDIKNPITSNDYQIKMGESIPHLTTPVIIDGFAQASFMGLSTDEVLVELRGDFMQLRSNARFYPDSTGLQDLRVPVMRVVVVAASDPDPKAFNCGSLRCKLVQNGALTTNIDIPTEEESGLFLRTKDTTIKGLAINRFGFPFATGAINNVGAGSAGIYVSGPGAVDPTAPITDVTIGTNNQILKNYIGTDATGKTPNTFTAGACIRPTCLGNAWNGLILNGASNNLIKGNIFGNNGRSGMSTENFTVLRGVPTPTNNRIIGNFVGVSDDGVTKVANNTDGLFLNGAQNVIGCTDDPYDPIQGCSKPDEANIVAGNGDAAFPFTASMGAITLLHNSKVLGNLIGVDKNGNILKNNKLPGIVVRGSNNLIQGNVIGGNGFNGINFSAINQNPGLSPTELNRVEYNKIGVNQFGNAVPNDQFGIAFISSSNKNLIAHNIIANNERGGISLMKFNGDNLGNLFLKPHSAPLCNSFLYNSIYNNGGVGIDLVGSVEPVATPATPSYPADGPTLNDMLDADSLDDCSVAVAGSKPNNLQNYPVLNAKRSFINPALVQVWGSLDSKPNRSYLIQAFSNQLADASEYGEGQIFIGEMQVTTDGSGHVDFHFPAMINAPVGSILSATATDLERGDTSEFGPSINVDPKGSPTAYDNANGAAGGDHSNAPSADPENICLDSDNSAFLRGSC